MAVGAAIGSALPHTRKEDALMGEQRDRSLQKTDGVGREQVEKGRSLAEQTGDRPFAVLEKAFAPAGSLLPYRLGFFPGLLGSGRRGRGELRRASFFGTVTFFVFLSSFEYLQKK